MPSAKNKKPKKIKISSKVAFVLSAAFLVLCVIMLFFSIAITKQSTSEDKQSVSEGKQSTSEQLRQTVTIPEKPPVSEIPKNPPSDMQVAKPVESANLLESADLVEKVGSQEKVSTQKKIDAQEQASTQKKENSQNIKSVQTTNTSENSKKIYIILDDGGHNTSQLQPFLDLPFSLAVAVLPKLPHTEDSCRNIVQAKKTLMLHQPMQAINRSVDPGPGAIEPEYSDEQIRSILNENIFQLNSAKAGNGKLRGINNHEGSLITENYKIMKIVLETCYENDVFFLDSRTNAASVCRDVAKEVGFQTGVQFFERNIFLDNTPNQEDMIAQFKRGVDYAEKHGSVIMIGHVWSGKNLADVLHKMYDEYSVKGFEFVSF